jgi:hypothetical protein
MSRSVRSPHQSSQVVMPAHLIGFYLSSTPTQGPGGFIRVTTRKEYVVIPPAGGSRCPDAAVRTTNSRHFTIITTADARLPMAARKHAVIAPRNGARHLIEA